MAPEPGSAARGIPGGLKTRDCSCRSTFDAGADALLARAGELACALADVVLAGRRRGPTREPGGEAPELIPVLLPAVVAVGLLGLAARRRWRRRRGPRWRG